MPKGGHNKKPTALRVLEGNPGKRPLPKNEPKPRPLMPKCPAWLPKEGKRLWRQLAPMLHGLNLLTEVDGQTFAALCLAWAQMVTAAKDVEQRGQLVPAAREGPGHFVRNPSTQILRESTQTFARIASNFGLDPQARARLGAAAQPNADDDDMSGILSGLGGRK